MPYDVEWSALLKMQIVQLMTERKKMTNFLNTNTTKESYLTSDNDINVLSENLNDSNLKLAGGTERNL